MQKTRSKPEPKASEPERHSRRRGTRPDPALARPDFPYTMKLPDGRTLLVEIPGRWVSADRDGSPVFLPDAVRFLDHIRAVAGGSLAQAPSPGYLTALREGLGMTQTEFGETVGVTKLTVSRWERGTLRPGPGPLVEIEKLRKTSLRRGVVIPG